MYCRYRLGRNFILLTLKSAVSFYRIFDLSNHVKIIYKNKEKYDRTFKIGLVSVSDRASAGVYQDQGIPELQAWLEQALVDPSI